MPNSIRSRSQLAKSGQGHSRRFDDVRVTSAYPSIADLQVTPKLLTTVDVLEHTCTPQDPPFHAAPGSSAPGHPWGDLMIDDGHRDNLGVASTSRDAVAWGGLWGARVSTGSPSAGFRKAHIGLTKQFFPNSVGISRSR
jgi:hypothetical protein